MLRARGFTTEQVQQIKEKNWAFFLKRCRRLVPPPRELLERFNKVIEEFGNCIDNDSREVLLRPKSRKAVRLLRKHIEAGCLSDPDGVAMYYVIGKTKDGLVNYRCVRGTNDVEVRFSSARCRLYSAGFVLRHKFQICWLSSHPVFTSVFYVKKGSPKTATNLPVANFSPVFLSPLW